MNIESAIETITLSISLLGVVVVVWGIMETFIGFINSKISGRKKRLQDVEQNELLRQNLGAHLLLALEIFIGADIISSVIRPSWGKVGILGVIVIIRTILSFFLERELKRVRPLQ